MEQSSIEADTLKFLDNIKDPIAICDADSFKIVHKNATFHATHPTCESGDDARTAFPNANMESLFQLALSERNASFECQGVHKRRSDIPFEYTVTKLTSGQLMLHGKNVLKTKEKELLLNSYASMMDEYTRLKELEKYTELASALQQSLIPPLVYEDDLFKICGFYRSAHTIGGDWFSYFIYGPKAHVYVGDVTGHGVASALLAGVVAGALEQSYHAAQVSSFHLPEPESTLKILNDIVIKVTSQSKLLMTMCCAEIDSESNIISIYNAGHPHPILFSQKQQTLKQVPSIGNRLGFTKDFQLRKKTMSYEQGDIIALFTDGLTEDHTKKVEMPQRQFFKILKTVLSNTATDLQQKVSNIVEETLGSVSRKTLDDDVSLVLIQMK